MTRRRHGPLQISVVWLTLVFSLILLSLLLGGCTLLRRPAPDPLAAYRPSLAQGFQVDPARLATMAQYSITLEVNPITPAYTGTVEVTLPVTVPLNELYFRLYPNLPQFNGQLQVTTASVNGMNVNYDYAAESSAVHLSLPKPLPAGQSAVIRMGFTGQPPARVDGVYTLFGKSKDILSLQTFYPILPARRTDGWMLDIADPQGDTGFQDAALYQVEVIAPADQIVVGTGTATGQRLAPNGWIATRFALGPAREFTLLLSPRFQMLQEEAYNTRVSSYFLPEDAEAGKSALYDAVAALEIYSDQFGAYPYRDMAVVEAPLTVRGQEFPGMSLIGSDTYSTNQNQLEKLIAHEVAHQWWYNQVGSDQIRTPWLDEGLAEFSMYLYYLGRYGREQADLLRLRRWEAPVALVRQKGSDTPIGLPVAAYKQRNYETIVYAKGALFFANLRDKMGDQVFRDTLRAYLEQNRWAIASPAGFRAIAERLSGKDLGAMFAEWVEGVVG